MPESKIVTEIAGRVCVIVASVGADVNEGDEIVFVEAMKMEIPVATAVTGRIKSILVRVDDVVAEGQAIALIET